MSFGRAVTPFGAALRFALVDQVLRVSPCGGLPSLGLRALLLAHRALMLAGVRGDHIAQLRITMFSSARPREVLGNEMQCAHELAERSREASSQGSQNLPIHCPGGRLIMH
jgi:hypothetical protein